MDANIERLSVFEATASSWIHLVGICIEIFGVFIIVAGIVWSTYLCVHWRASAHFYDEYKIRIGRSLLLGLEVLGSRLIKSTIQEQRRDILRRGSFAPAGRIGLQCA